jgi:hypothetical protein
MSIESKSGRPLTRQLKEIPNAWVMFSLITALQPKIAKKTEGAEDYLR